MKRVCTVFVCLVFLLTAVASVGQLYATPTGCCGSDPDCEVIGDPYQPCSPLGPNNEKCKQVHPYLTNCCDLQGWCGP